MSVFFVDSVARKKFKKIFNGVFRIFELWRLRMEATDPRSLGNMNLVSMNFDLSRVQHLNTL